MAPMWMPWSEQDQTGLNRLATGSALGVAAAILGIVLPVFFLLIATYIPSGFLALDQPGFLDATGILILAGAILFLFCFLIYRNAFAHLRKVDRRFVLASVLCLLGSIGFLLILVAAVVVIGTSSSLVSCISGQPSHALSCLRSGQPLGAYTGLVGFWLGWLGGVGIVLGLSAGSSRFHNRDIGFGALSYALLLLILIGPFVSLVVAFPGVQYVLLAVPVLSLVAPFFVYLGAGGIAP
jgi:NADH:ubiquinone oxidoreductase subunit 6 (subunit J)